MGLSTIAAGVAGGVAMGPVGAAVGMGVGVGVNQVVKVVAGQSVDELAGNVVEGVGNGAKKLGEYVGVSEEQEKLLGAKKKCQEKYVAPEREPVKAKGQGKEAFAKGHDEALRREKLGIESPTKTVSKTQQKPQSLSEGLQGVKETLSKPVVETTQRPKSVSSSREL